MITQKVIKITFKYMISPFSLMATIKKHTKNYTEKHPKHYEMLNSVLFVDDLLYKSNTV